MADISMNLNDTLELDTIIKKSSKAQNPINSINYSGPNSKDYNMKGIETHTSVFDPQQSGTYKIDINGQELTVKVNKASAIPDSLVENFEADDVEPRGVYASGETITDYYNGDTEDFARNTSNPIQGIHDLEGGSSGSKPIIYSLEGDGLNRYPAKGEKFSTFLRDDLSDNETANPGFGYAMAGSAGSLDGYLIRIGVEFNSYEIIRLDDGVSTSLKDKSPNLSEGQLYEIEVQLHDGTGSETEDTHECTLYQSNSTDLSRVSEVDSFTVSDATHTGNTGVAYIMFSNTQSGGGGHIDEYNVLGSVD